MDLQQIAVAGVAAGTVLLFAAIGEILAERAGVLNLGVEGMMLMGAVSAFSVTLSTGNPWLGLVVAMLVGGLLGLLHGVVTVQLLADQVVSGLALTFLGTGLARVLGDGLTNLEAPRLPTVAIPGLASLPVARQRSSSRCCPTCS
jgi:simple sugar transport system permease protein